MPEKFGTITATNCDEITDTHTTTSRMFGRNCMYVCGYNPYIAKRTAGCRNFLTKNSQNVTLHIKQHCAHNKEK